MKKRSIIYLIITIIFITASSIILNNTDIHNNILLSKSIQIILIMALIRISIGCMFYIKKQHEKRRYSYAIIMNVGLLLFIDVNILRMINLLIKNWNVLSIVDIYNNTIKSFSYFAMLTLPCIIVLSLYSIITNIVLIKKEGYSINNLLGIALGALSLLGLGGSQTIYYLVSKLLVGTDKQIIKYALEICINATLSYFYTLVIATLYCNVKAANNTPKYDKDFIIILGSQINKDGTLKPLLKGRTDKAIEFANAQYKNSNKKIIYIPSGGQGEDETISEAEAIKRYLIQNGIDKKQIIIEDKSTSTYENLKNSKTIINKIKREGSIVFSTTNYHVFRSGIIANREGIECEGIGSKTKWYFYTNALIREFIANIVEERKNHIILLLMINATLLALIFIGRYYNFLTIIN